MGAPLPPSALHLVSLCPFSLLSSTWPPVRKSWPVFLPSSTSRARSRCTTAPLTVERFRCTACYASSWKLHRGGAPWALPALLTLILTLPRYLLSIALAVTYSSEEMHTEYNLPKGSLRCRSVVTVHKERAEALKGLQWIWVCIALHYEKLHMDPTA